MGFVVLCDCENCTTAVFLMNDPNVDRSASIDLMNSSLSLIKPLHHEKAMFVVNAEEPMEKSNDWMESSFCLNTDFLFRGRNENLSFDLLIILVPRQTVKSDSQVEQNIDSVLLGHLSMHTQSRSRVCRDLVPPHLVTNSCLFVETACPISYPDIAFIVSHQCFSSDSEKNISECLENAAEKLEHVNIFKKVTEHLKIVQCESIADDNSHLASLCLLHWKVSHSELINFYLIYLLDDSGVEHFIGASVSNYYILKQKQRRMYPAGFYILPVMKDVGLYGQKLFLDFSRS